LPFLSRFDGGNQGFTWELEEQQWRGERERERGKHWCSIIVGLKEDDMNSIGDHYGQEERVFKVKSSNGQNKGGIVALARPTKD